MKKNSIDVHLEEAFITSSLCEKLLGITIDSDLKFGKHISELSNKVSKKQMHYAEVQVVCF